MSNTAKFFVRRDDVNYRVKDFETLLRWLGEGRLCGTDLFSTLKMALGIDCDIGRPSQRNGRP